MGQGEEKAHERALQRLEAAFSEIKDPLDFIHTQEQSLNAKVSGRLLHKVPDPKSCLGLGVCHRRIILLFFFPFLMLDILVA
jgi:hypothetical protein